MVGWVGIGVAFTLFSAYQDLDYNQFGFFKEGKKQGEPLKDFLDELRSFSF